VSLVTSVCCICAQASPGADEPPSVPAGFVGRFRHASECTSLDEYARSVAAAIEERSRALLGGGGGDAAGDGGVPAVERVALEGVSPTQFMGRWARQGRPVVLTGCMAGWDTECWSPQVMAADDSLCFSLLFCGPPFRSSAGGPRPTSCERLKAACCRFAGVDATLAHASVGGAPRKELRRHGGA
jgi:hypothetical protein